MKPYGNEHMMKNDSLNSTKHGAESGNHKTSSRRVYKKIRRAQTKSMDRKEFYDSLPERINRSIHGDPENES